MSGKIKLNAASGGGSVSIQAPSSESNNRTLTLPSDADGTIVSKDTTNNLANIASINGGSIGTKNLIINGGMTVSQRNATTATAVTSANQYTLDRIKGSNNSDAAFTIAQSSTAPDGFSNSLKVDVTTADTSLDAGHYGQIIYHVEAQDLQQLAFGTSGAKACVLSFYVRSNKTGNYGVAVLQSDNGSKQVSFQYTINSADTWERKSFVIPGDTSGVINNDTGAGFDIHIGFAAGTTYTSGNLRSSFTAFANGDFYAGQGVNLFDSTSNEWYITGIQLEVGSTASAFAHESYADTFLKCQRYYHVLLDSRIHENKYWRTGYYYADGMVNIIGRISPEMRTTPTATVTSGTDYYRFYRNSSYDAVDDFILAHSSKNSYRLYNSTDASGTAGQSGGFYLHATSIFKLIAFDAEL